MAEKAKSGVSASLQWNGKPFFKGLGESIGDALLPETKRSPGELSGRNLKMRRGMVDAGIPEAGDENVAPSRGTDAGELDPPWKERFK
jgi:hypothetical protein